MYILGLNYGEFNTSCALIKNGKILHATQEERHTREKFTKKFPINSIKEILKIYNLKISDINAVCSGWNPASHLTKYNPLVSSQRTLRENNFYSLADNLLLLDNDRDESVFTELNINFKNKKIPKFYHIHHHTCHAANGFFLSNFKKAAILSVDSRGENDCTAMFIGNNNKLEKKFSQEIPNSLGLFYSAFTQFLGYRPDSDEWKVMAMSAFNTNCMQELKKIKKCYHLENGKLFLNQKYFSPFTHTENTLYTHEFKKLFSLKTNKDSSHSSKVRIAKALQICAEEIATYFLNHLYKLTKSENLVVCGGFFMNSVFNGKILNKTKFKKIYIPYAPTDTGNAIGSALYLYNCILKKKRIKQNQSPFLGSNYSNNQILQTLKRRKIRFKKITNFKKQIAQKCFDGKIVAYFRNRMEFGDRSLGARSILGDPRFSSNKDKINAMVKYREKFRPFAPSVIFEKTSKFFDVNKNFENHYMEKVVKVKNKYRNKLPAITHYDGSARVQTVSKEFNSDFYGILLEFEKLTGFPILLNTSLNINSEPIVMSPDDAINNFYNSGLDCLFLEDYMVEK